MSDSDNSDGPLTVDAAAAALSARREDGAAPAAERPPIPDYAPPEQEEPVKAGAAEAETEAEQEAEAAEDDAAEEEQADDQPAPTVEPPRSWSKEDKAAWAKIPRDVQEIIARRETDRDQAVNKVTATAGQINSVLRDMSAKYEDLSGKLQNDWNRRWGSVDWVAAAQQLTPEEYNSYRAQAEQEWSDVKAAEQEAERAAKVARETFLAEESQKLAQLSPELADPEKGAERRQKTAEYLVKQGVGQDALRDISALELTIAHKARLWDEAQAEAKRRASLPKRAEPQPGPKAVKPTGQGALSPQRELQGLESKLTKVGKTGNLNAAYDAAADLIAARRAQSQRGTR